MNIKFKWWKAANPLSIKLSLIVCALIWIFAGLQIAIHGPSKEDIFFSIIAFSTASFAMTWLSTQLGYRIIAGSSGALRLGIVLSMIWILIETIFYLNPFDKSSRDAEAFAIFTIPLLVFWSILWILNGFLKDKQN